MVSTTIQNPFRVTIFMSQFGARRRSLLFIDNRHRRMYFPRSRWPEPAN